MIDCLNTDNKLSKTSAKEPMLVSVAAPLLSGLSDGGGGRIWYIVVGVVAIETGETDPPTPVTNSCSMSSISGKLRSKLSSLRPCSSSVFGKEGSPRKEYTRIPSRSSSLAPNDAPAQVVGMVWNNKGVDEGVQIVSGIRSEHEFVGDDMSGDVANTGVRVSNAGARVSPKGSVLICCR